MGDPEDDYIVELPAAVLQAMARGEAIRIALPDYPSRLVLCCTDEAINQFQAAVLMALLHNLRPADGVH